MGEPGQAGPQERAPSSRRDRRRRRNVPAQRRAESCKPAERLSGRGLADCFLAVHVPRTEAPALLLAHGGAYDPASVAMKFCPTCKATLPGRRQLLPPGDLRHPERPPAAADGGRLPAGGVAQAAQVPDGKGRFQLGPRIGGGSTGEVYRATDSQTGAQVAYKIVNSDVLPNPATLARAEREFKQLMRVQSPRIASVIDCGRTADERLYVAMELCEGEPLDRAAAQRA